MQRVEKRVVIVGASAAGLRCAARLARLEPTWEITVIEARSVFSVAACGLPYALSGDVPDPEALRQTADGTLRDVDYFAAVKGVTVRAGTPAARIEADHRRLRLGRGETLEYDELVLATGARPKPAPRQPEHPRVHTFHTFADLEPLVAGLKGRRIGSVVVVGAGLCGCELAEAFAVTWGAEVTLLEAAAHPLPMLLDAEVGALAAHALKENDVELRTGARVDRIEATEGGVTVHANAAEGPTEVAADAVVVALGVAPAVELAQSAGVELGVTGGIAVDERLHTSVPHIWACGDCIELVHAVSGCRCQLPLGSLANRHGRLLADILAGGSERLTPVAGAAGLKIFDTNVAAVGLTRAQAVAQGLPARSAWLCGHDRAHYYPEAQEIALQLVYEPGSERILGVQAAGPGEVHKRIDTATQLLLRGARLADLAAIEHAYAPPYAPAIEPLATLAMVAQNQERGLDAVSPLSPLSNARLLDVRHPHESQARPVPANNVVLLPQAHLRERARDLDPGEWLVVCERGTRAAEVARWLSTRSLTARYLGGGLRWRGLAGDPAFVGDER